jgi:hypothetical protein
LFRGQLPGRRVLIGLPLLSIGTFALGYWYFNRLKAVFADHV